MCSCALPAQQLGNEGNSCRVEQIEDEEMLSPHAYVRAIVELEDRFRRANQSQVADEPDMRCVRTHMGWQPLASELRWSREGQQLKKIMAGMLLK